MLIKNANEDGFTARWRRRPDQSGNLKVAERQLIPPTYLIPAWGGNLPYPSRTYLISGWQPYTGNLSYPRFAKPRVLQRRMQVSSAR